MNWKLEQWEESIRMISRFGEVIISLSEKKGILEVEEVWGLVVGFG